jgi:hypothetical protein
MTHKNRKKFRNLQNAKTTLLLALRFFLIILSGGLYQHGCKYRKDISTHQCPWTFHDPVRQSLWSCMCRVERLNSQLAETR